MRNKPTKKLQPVSRIEALEPRVLYSADLLPGAIDTSDDWNDTSRDLDNILTALTASDFAEDSANDTDTASDHYRSYEIVFIGSGIADIDALITDMQQEDPLRHLEIVVLDPDLDSLGQIGNILAERSGLDAIHLFAHGDEGQINFGNDTLDLGTLAEQREALSAWSHALSEDADLLIYGCNLAGSEDGAALVEQLALLTGADVAASDDLTGAEALGGDWDLEITTGSIEVNMVLSEAAQQKWTASLATFTVTNLNSSGVGSFDWAMNQAESNNPAIDTINFAVSGTIIVNNGFTISDTVIIDGTSAPGYGGTPTVTIDGSAAGVDIGFAFQGGSNSSILQGLNIQGFDAGLITVGVGSISIENNFLGTDLSGTALGAGGITGDIISVLSAGHDARIIDNVISGGDAGIRIHSADNAIIQGNFIGTDATGTAALANATGIVLQNGARGVLVGTNGDTINDANEGNVISGNTGDGIYLVGGGSDDNIIAGNLIGVRADLAFTLGNGDDGIDTDPSVDGLTIGGVGVGNVIAGNADNGIAASDIGTNLVIQGNYVGTDATGTEHWGNLGFGIVVDSTTGGVVTIGGIAAGEGNIVAHNGFDDIGGGVVVFHATTDTVSIRGNSIFDNFGLGVDLGDDGLTINDAGDGDTGANTLQNSAVLTSATTDEAGNVAIDGNTLGFKGGTYTIDVYASSVHDADGHSEGERYLFSDTVTDGSLFSLNQAGISLNAGEYITVLITDINGNTSEFSNTVIATALSGNSAPNDIYVSDVQDGGLELNTTGNAAYLRAEDGVFGGLTQFTIETRFTFSNDGSAHALLSYHTAGSNDDVLLMLDASGNLVVHTDGDVTTTSGYDFNTLAGTGEHTLSVTWSNSGTLNVYVDGALEFTDATHAVGLTVAAGGQLVIGQNQNGLNNFTSPGDAFSGSIYELRIFDVVRSGSEIATSQLATLPYNTPNMAASWSFEEYSSTGTVVDSVSGNRLFAEVLTGAGWTGPRGELQLQVDENATIGTVVGAVGAIDADRQAAITNALALNPNLMYSAETNEFYEVSNFGNWSSAELGAQGSLIYGTGGQLVVIGSQFENDLAVAALTRFGSGTGWIGASDETTEGQWYWRQDGVDNQQFWTGDFTGSAVNNVFHSWENTDPNAGVSGNVAVIEADGLWRDRQASDIYSAIVEWDANEVLQAQEALTYSFAPGGDAGGAFAIDVNTGVITVADPNLIDYESASTMTVTVRVTDDDSTFYDEALDIEIGNEGGDASLSLPVPQSGDEDVGIVFSVANGNAVTVDSGGYDNPAMTATLSVANGTLTLASVSGITFLDGTGDGQSTITIFGLESDLNAALDGLSYDPDADYFGSDTLNVTTGSAAPNLVAAYDFEDGSLLDNSGNGNDAAFVNGSANPALEVTSERGDVYSFDGDDHVEITGRYGDPTTLTLAAWVNLDAGQTDSVVMSIGDEVVLTLDSGTGVALRVGSSSLGSGVNIAGTGWHHVAATYDDVTGVVDVYVDGVLYNSAVLAPGSVDWASAPQANSAIGNSFGSDVFTDIPMVGEIDAARVYDRVLTGSEIALLAGHQGVASGSVALTVDPVNDEQSLDVNNGQTVLEGSNVGITSADLDTNDIDNTPAQIIYTVTTVPANGWLELTTNVGVPINAFTQADINAGLLIFVHDGSETTSDSFDFTVDDGQGTTSSGTFNLTVTPVNDEQTLDINLGQTVNEDSSVGITAAELATGDVDNTPAQIVYTVTTVPANGWLELTTNVGVPINAFTQADINAGLLIFVHDGSETTGDSFDFTVDDGQGTSSSGTFNLTVTPVNDEQTLDVNLGQTVNEGSNVSITAAELATNDVDNTPVQIVYTVTTVPVNGWLELTTNVGVPINAFTQADINAGLLIFVHDGSETTSDSFDFTVDDGQGTSSSGTFNLTVTPVNDEQTLDINNGQTVLEDSSVGITAAELATGDVDNTPAQIIYTVTTVPVNGWLELTTNVGVPINAFTQADINAGLLIFVHDGSETTSDSFDFTVDDGQGTASSGTFNLTVIPVNDEQTLDINNGQTVLEDSSVGITAAELATGDVDNTPAQIIYTVTTVPVNGWLELTTNVGVPINAFTQADINAGLLIFVHDGSETTSDSFDFTVDDGQGTTSSGTFNLTVTPVNDEQTLDVNLGQTVNEGSNVSITAAELATNDVDNTPVQIVYTVTTVPVNGWLELTTNVGVPINAFTQADINAGLLIFVHDGSETTGDSFDFTVDDGQGTTSSGTFNLTVTPVNDEQTLDVNLGQTVNEGSNVSITAAELATNDVDNTPVQIVYTVTTVPVNGWLELTTNVGVPINAFTQADINAGLLIFVHDGSETTSDSFDFTVDDGQGTSSSGTFNLTVTPVNDEQTLDINLGQTVNEGSNVSITAAELATNDVDNTPVQIVYTVTTVPVNGWLELTTNVGVPINAFTQADINAGLLIFVHDGSETTSDSFDFTVDDGQGTSSSGTFNLTVTPVNDEQTLDINNGQTVLEDSSVGITAAELATGDVDNTPAQIIYTVTTVPVNGWLELTTNVGVPINAFTQADINAGLLIFVHDGSETTSDSFDFTVDDGQGTASSGTFNLTVIPVNDEQTLDINNGQTVLEDSSVGITAAELATGDVDNTPAQIIYTVTTVPVNGWLELTTNVGVPINAFTQADINAGLLIFVHDGSETTSDSFDFTVDDGQGTTSSGTFNLTVTPVNDEQTLDVNLGQTVNEGSNVGITAAELATNDVDNTPVQIVYTVTTVPVNGWLELTTNVGVPINAFTQADINAGLLIFVHDGSETTGDSFDFTVDDGQGTTSSGTFNLTVTPVNDEQTLDVNLGQTVNEGSNVSITAAELATNDVDNTPVQIVYTVTTVPVNGWLELTTNVGVPINAFTQADINAGLLIFVHDGSETTSDSFDFTVDDGQGTSSSGTFNLTVTPVNDEQTLDINLGQTVNEGSNVSITAAELATNDVDNTPVQIVYTVTTVPVNGWLELTTNVGVPINAFTQADINAGLLIFVHDGSETTSDSFDFTVDDGQGTSSSGTFNLTVTPVNDEQTLDINNGQTVLEDSSVGITAAELATGDVDNTPAQIIYTVTTVPVNGWLELTTNVGVPINAFTQADINAGLLIFVHDGSETTSDSFDFTVDDGQGTASSGTFNLTVIPVNDEQTLDINNGQTVLEDSSVGITAAELATGDVDNTPAQIIYTVTTVPVNGWLELTTNVGVPINAFTQADINAGLLIFVHDGSETTSDSFDFTVDDGQGTTSSGTFNLTVTPVNDEQTLDVNLGQTVNEGSNVSITAAELATNDVDNTPVQIVYTVTTVPVNGWLELTTNVGVPINAFTQADINAGLLIFVHDGSETTGDSFDFTVDDGQGTTSSGTFNLTVTPVNDEQTLDVNLGQTVNEGSNVSITAAELATNDVDNTPVQIVYTVTTVPVNGWLELTTNVGVPINAFTQADINAGLLIFVHDGSETTGDSFDFTVDDGQGTSSSGTFNLTVTPVNDEQTLDVNLGQTVNEGSNVSITAAELATNDVDNTPVQIVYTVTTVPVNGWLELTTNVGVPINAFTQADINAGLLIFVHDGSETTSDSFDFTVDDGQGTSSSGTFNLTVTPVNDEQTLDINNGQTVLEDSSVGITAAELATGDVDNTPVQIVYTVTTVPVNGWLELTTNVGVPINAFTQADINAGLLIFVHDGSETTSDSFDFTVDDGQGTTSSGTFNLTVTPVNDEQTLDINNGQTVLEDSSVAISAAELATNDVDNTPAQIVYTVTMVPVNGQLELTTAAGVAITTFTQADIDAGLLLFVHNGSETTSDSFDFTVDDGQGTTSSGTFNLTVTPVNDEQTLDVNLGQTVNEGGSVAITSTELATNDVDNSPAQIVYAVTTIPVNGQLELTTAAGVAITSFTQSDINAGLLVFVHNGSETTGDSFDFTVDDGQGTVSSGTFTLTVTPMNDEQTLDINLGQTVNEGGSAGITSAELATNDVDNAPAQIVYTVMTIPVNGQLQLTTAAGVAITSFTQADIDAGLLVFVHNGSETTSDSFDFTVDDGQGTTSSGTFTLTVTPVNDEQTLDVNLGQTVNEGSNVSITAAELATNDVDNTPVQIVYTVTTVPVNGWLELTTNVGVPINAFTQADINAGLLIFVHDGSETTSDSFDFTVDDGQGTTSSGTFNLTVTPVNDEQTLDINLGQTVNEGSSVGITAAELATGDVDNTPVQIVYTVTTVPVNGWLELTTNVGVPINAFTQADINAGLLIFVHDGSETTSDSFDFTADDGQGTASSGTFNLTVTPVNDEQTLDVNLGQTVNEGGSVAITSTELATNDTDNTPAQIVYTVTTVPVNGQLELTTAAGVAISSFTQADIDSGLLVFVHDGSETTGDQFDFVVDDGTGAATLGSFNLVVTAVNDAPVIELPATTLQATEQVVLDLHNRGLQIQDVDAGSAFLTVSLTVSEGNITVSPPTTGPNGNGINQIQGNGSSTVIINATLNAINEMLGGVNGARVEYMYDSDTPESQVELSIAVDDHNNGGFPSTDGSRDTADIPIQVQAVDDAPVFVSNGGAASVLLTSIENLDTVAQLSANDIDTIVDALSFSIVGGDDASRFSVDANGQVRFLTAPRYDLPVDSNGDNIYRVVVAVSDGTSSTTQELVVSVLKTGGPIFSENPVINPINPLAESNDAQVESESTDAVDESELAQVLAPVSRLPVDNSANDNNNSLRDLAPPASIVIDDSVVDSIAPSPALDDPTKLVSDSSTSLIRKLLLAGTQGPAKISIDLTTAIYQNSFGNEEFLQGLDRMRTALDEAINQDNEDSEIISSVAVGATATLTVGFIGWLLRAGSLLAGVLSSAPLWRHLDPFALFYRRNKREDEAQSASVSTNEDRKLDHLFRGGSGGTQ